MSWQPCSATQAMPVTKHSSCLCRARRRRVLSQFEDLQQCYLRLRKSGKTPAAAAGLPSSPFQQATLESGGSQPPSKRFKQEQQPQAEVAMDCTPAADPCKEGRGAEAGVSPAEPSVCFPAASQVCFVCMVGSLHSSAICSWAVRSVACESHTQLPLLLCSVDCS